MSLTIEVVVNGHPCKVRVSPADALITAMSKAIKASGTSPRLDVDRFELRDEAGRLFEKYRSFESLSIGNGARLFMSMPVGFGG